MWQKSSLSERGRTGDQIRPCLKMDSRNDAGSHPAIRAPRGDHRPPHSSSSQRSPAIIHQLRFLTRRRLKDTRAGELQLDALTVSRSDALELRGRDQYLLVHPLSTYASVLKRVHRRGLPLTWVVPDSSRHNSVNLPQADFPCVLDTTGIAPHVTAPRCHLSAFAKSWRKEARRTYSLAYGAHTYAPNIRHSPPSFQGVYIGITSEVSRPESSLAVAGRPVNLDIMHHASPLPCD